MGKVRYYDNHLTQDVTANYYNYSPYILIKYSHLDVSFIKSDMMY